MQIAWEMHLTSLFYTIPVGKNFLSIYMFCSIILQNLFNILAQMKIIL